MGLRSNAFVVLAACAVLCVILISRPLAEPPTAAAPARIAESSALRRDLGALRETLRSEQAAAAATKRRSEEASKRRSEAAAAALRDEQQAAAVSRSKQAAAAAKLRREQAAAAAQQAAATAQQAAAPPQQAPPQQAPPQPAPPRRAPPEPRLELTPAPTSVSSPRAAVLIVGIARSLFLPRVHVLTRRYLVDALASRGARVDVFLRLDKTIQKTEGSEAQRHGGGGARGIAERAGTLPESLWNRAVALAEAVAYGKARGFAYDYFVVARSDVCWYRPAPPLQAFSRDHVTTPDVWMLTANDQFAVAPAGARTGSWTWAAGAWWCFGNAYGGSPFHTTTPPKRACLAAPIAAAVPARLGPFGAAGDERVIADDVVDHYCCTGDRGTLFNTDVGHTEHLLARKICGVAGKHACGDHFGGFKHLDMRRLVQTVVRSTGGADCGRLINYQGNKAIRAFGRPSVANYLTCVLAFHDCEFRDRARAVLGPWSGSPVADRAAGFAPEAMARRCAWPPAAMGPDGDAAAAPRNRRRRLFAPLRPRAGAGGVELLWLDPRWHADWRCVVAPPNGGALRLGACAGLGERRGKPPGDPETAFAHSGNGAAPLVDGASGLCVVGSAVLAAGPCAAAVEVALVEPRA
ncbi:ATPase [Aureococcus anophagefferens]|nr:ATPase [Aureococcus anophagefferens]